MDSVDGRVIGLDVTPGTVTVVDGAPEDPVAALTVARSTLIELMLLGKTVAKAETEGKAEGQGDRAAIERLLDLYRLSDPDQVLAATS